MPVSQKKTKFQIDENTLGTLRKYITGHESPFEIRLKDNNKQSAAVKSISVSVCRRTDAPRSW